MTLASEQSAARFLALRARRRRRVDRGEWILAAGTDDGRVAIDFTPATLRVVHRALVDAEKAWANRADVSDADYEHLYTGEQMIAAVLGLPTEDDPPATDRRGP